MQTELFSRARYVMASPVCRWCKFAIRGPRLVVQGSWCCSTCAFYLDKGEDPPQKVGP